MAKIKIDDVKKSIVGSIGDSSVLQAIEAFEKARQQVIKSIPSNKINESTIKNLKNTIGLKDFQSAFQSIKDYDHYKNIILSDLNKSSLNVLEEDLNKSYTSYLKPDIQRTLEAIGYTEKNLSELSQNAGINTENYLSQINSAVNSIQGDSLSKAAKSLTSSMKQIETDMFQDKIKNLTENNLRSSYAMEPIEIPESPMIGQNKQIIKLIEIQNQTLLETSQYISSQNEKLDTQNKIIDEEIKDNKQAANQAFWTAIGSITIAILATLGAIWVSYDIYTQEDASSNKQHKEVIQLLGKIMNKDNTNIDTIDNSKDQTEILKQILVEIQHQNKINDQTQER